MKNNDYKLFKKENYQPNLITLKHLTIGDLRSALNSLSCEQLPLGFVEPHSFRGIHSEVAFELAYDVPVSVMREAIEDALSREFIGWKGDYFFYHEYTPVWLTGVNDRYSAFNYEPFTSLALRYMLCKAARPL